MLKTRRLKRGYESLMRCAGLVLTAALAVLSIAGCAGPDKTRPLAPLPKEALLALEELTPAVIRPEASAPEELSPRVASMAEEGEAALAKADFATAISKLERAVGFSPNSPRIHRALGLAYAGLLNPGRAMTHLRLAAKGVGDDLEVQIMLGRLSEGRRKNDEAITAYRIALKCSQASDENPMVGEALWRLGELLAPGGYHTAALECYQRLYTNIERYGRTYRDRTALRGIISRPEVLLVRQGEMLLKLRRADEAFEPLNFAYRQDRTNPVIVRLLMDSLLKAGKFDQATKFFEELASESSLKQILPELAQSLCDEVGDKKLPLRLWESHRSKGGANVPLALALARAAVEMDAEDSAVTIVLSALERSPADADAGRFLVRLYIRRNQADKALVRLAEMLAANESTLPTINGALREISKSPIEDAFERKFAAKVEKERTKPLHALLYVTGRLAQLRDKMHLAAQLFEKSSKLKQDFLPAYQAAADVYIAQKRYGQVDRLIEQLLRRDPDTVLAHLLQGKVFIAKGEPAKAVASLQRTDALKNGHVSTILLMSDALIQVGRIVEAQNVLLRAMTQSPEDTEVHRRLFRLYIRVKNPTQARAIAAKLPRESISARLMLAELDLLEGKLDTAGKILAELHSQAPDNVDLRLLEICLALARKGSGISGAEWEALIKQLRSVLADNPASGEAELLGALLTKAGKKAAAAAVWGLLHQKLPGDVHVARTYAIALGTAGKNREAADIIEKLINADPDDHKLRLALVELLLRTKQYKRGAAHGKRGLAKAPDPRSVERFRLLLLEIYEGGEMFDDAQKLLDEWIPIAADSLRMSLRARKVFLYEKAKQIDKAEKYTLAWIAKSPQVLLPRQLLVGVLSDAERYDDVTKLLKGWLAEREVQPAKPDEIADWCRVAMMSMLMRQGEYELALEKIDAFLLKNLKDVGLLELKSTCLSELGRPKLALVEMEKAYKLKPKDPGLNNNLGYKYADAGVNLDKAERMIRLALREMPDTVSFLDSLAWVLYKQGDFAAAGRVIQRVLDRENLDDLDHPVIYNHAGDVFHRLGHKDKAVEFWKRSLEAAKKEKQASRDIRDAMKGAAAKIKAVESDKVPEVAPLGKGVKIEPPSPSTKPSV